MMYWKTKLLVVVCCITILFVCFIQRLTERGGNFTHSRAIEVLKVAEANMVTEGDTRIVNVVREKDKKDETDELKGSQAYKSSLNSSPAYALLTDSECEPVVPRLSDVPLPLVGLISFPGSGNTWARHLIQQVSGIGTSSVYCDPSLRKHGFPFECQRRSNRTIVVKSHRHGQNAFIIRFESVILLIRNPFNAILSYFHYSNREHIGHADDSKFFTKDWNEFVFRKLKIWSQAHRTWLKNFTRPVYPLLYENLQQDLPTELRKIFDFLQFNVTTDAILCTVKNQEGNFHREKKDILNKDKKAVPISSLYNKQMVASVNEAIDEISSILKNRFNIELTYTVP